MSKAGACLKHVVGQLSIPAKRVCARPLLILVDESRLEFRFSFSERESFDALLSCSFVVLLAGRRPFVVQVRVLAIRSCDVVGG